MSDSNVEATWRIDSKQHESLSQYLLYRRHLFAYEEACRRLSQPRTVVDIACGLGYALHLIQEAAGQIIAIDLAKTALQRLPRGHLVRPVRATASALPIRPHSADIVMAFQLIEHLPIPVALQVLREIKGALRPGGRAFVTTPNARWRLLPGQRPWNPYHVTEYSPRTIVQLCEKACIGEYQIFGVVGKGGAQEIELARVRQDPLSVWGGAPGRYLRAFSDRFTPASKATLVPDPATPVNHDHASQEWFALSKHYQSGLDFFIELLA